MKASDHRAERLTLTPTTLLCGRFAAGDPLERVAQGRERGFLGIVFDKVAARLPRLGLTRNPAGDSSGSRFRQLEGDHAQCGGEGDILITVSLTPGPSGGGAPPAGRPAILPYTLTLLAEQGRRRWTTRIRRSADDAHSGVTPDPRTRSPVAATRASIVHDLEDAGNSFAHSLRGTE